MDELERFEYDTDSRSRSFLGYGNLYKRNVFNIEIAFYQFAKQ